MNFQCLEAIKIAHKWYSKKKFDHGLRVAEYACKEAQYPYAETKEHEDKLFIIALLHDILEDMDCPHDVIQMAFGDDIYQKIWLLTKKHEDNYPDYIQSLLDSKDLYVFLTKKADLKDHLTQRETLTDKLKEKYVMVVGDFL